MALPRQVRHDLNDNIVNFEKVDLKPSLMKRSFTAKQIGKLRGF